MKSKNDPERPAPKSATQARCKRPTYSLEELLARCDFTQPYSEQELAFLHAKREGRELL